MFLKNKSQKINVMNTVNSKGKIHIGRSRTTSMGISKKSGDYPEILLFEHVLCKESIEIMKT